MPCMIAPHSPAFGQKSWRSIEGGKEAYHYERDKNRGFIEMPQLNPSEVFK